MEKFQEEFVAFLKSAIEQQKKMADRAMLQFIALRLTLVITSASLPALITLAGQTSSSVVAVLVAALTGLDTQFRWGEEWRHFRSTQLALQRMQRDFAHRASALVAGRIIGNIKTEADNFDHLYSSVEELLQTEADRFFKFRITEWRQTQGVTT